jgi:hypothetical protein
MIRFRRFRFRNTGQSKQKNSVSLIHYSCQLDSPMHGDRVSRLVPSRHTASWHRTHHGHQLDSPLPTCYPQPLDSPLPTCYPQPLDSTLPTCYPQPLDSPLPTCYPQPLDSMKILTTASSLTIGVAKSSSILSRSDSN